MPTEFEWAYLAGIIDGEGCITISIRSNRKLFSVIHRLMVYNTNKEMIDWIASRFGGSQSIHIREGSNHKPDGIHEGYGQKAVYRLAWASADSITHILGGVLPYLVSKKLAAEMLVALLALPPQMEGDKMELFDLIKEVQHG